MDRIPAPPYLGCAGRRIYAQIASVLDPFATRHDGQPARVIRPQLRRAWHDAFAATLPAPTLSLCAQAIADRRPWQLALWHVDGPTPPRPGGTSTTTRPPRGVSPQDLADFAGLTGRKTVGSP